MQWLLHTHQAFSFGFPLLWPEAIFANDLYFPLFFYELRKNEILEKIILSNDFFPLYIVIDFFFFFVLTSVCCWKGL